MAKDGLIELNYSQSVQDESMHVATRKGLEADIAAAFISLMLHAKRITEPAVVDIWLPDEGDVHVLQSAIASGSNFLITENLRDFPVAACAPHGIIAQSPDQFIAIHWPKFEDALMPIAKSAGQKQLKNAKLYKLAKRLRISC